MSFNSDYFHPERRIKKAAEKIGRGVGEVAHGLGEASHKIGDLARGAEHAVETGLHNIEEADKNIEKKLNEWDNFISDNIISFFSSLSVAPWPPLVTATRGDSNPVRSLAAQLDRCGTDYENYSKVTNNCHKEVAEESTGTAINAIGEKISHYATALSRESEDFTYAGNEATIYANELDKLQVKHDAIQHERDQFASKVMHDVKSAPLNFRMPDPLLSAIEESNILRNAVADLEFAYTSAEDRFIDALGMEKFPDPDTGEYQGVVTAAERDVQNRAKLNEILTRLRGKDHLSDAERKELANAEAIETQIKHIDDHEIPGSHGQHARAVLYSFDTTCFQGDGKALIGIGDLDHAKNVAFNVPGITSDLEHMPKPGEFGDDAIHVYDEVYKTNPNASYAGMICLGYDAPSGHRMGGETANARSARAGGLELGKEIDEYAATRKYQGTGQAKDPKDDKLNLTLIGHSYGSTTASYAAAEGRLAGEIDNLTLIGSPGAGSVQNASEYGLGSGHVFVGQDKSDPVAQIGGALHYTDTHRREVGLINIGTLLVGGPNLTEITKITQSLGLGLGYNPYSPDFGATPFDGSDNHRPINIIGAHTDYMHSDTPSIRNIGRIVNGNENTITPPNK